MYIVFHFLVGFQQLVQFFLASKCSVKCLQQSNFPHGGVCQTSPCILYLVPCFLEPSFLYLICFLLSVEHVPGSLCLIPHPLNGVPQCLFDIQVPHDIVFILCAFSQESLLRTQDWCLLNFGLVMIAYPYFSYLKVS